MLLFDNGKTVSPRARSAVAAAALCLAFLVASCRLVDYAPSVDSALLAEAKAAIAGVSGTSLSTYMDAFNTPRNFMNDPAAISACRDYMVAAFKAMGYADADIVLDPVTVQALYGNDANGTLKVTAGPFSMPNILVTKRGSDPSLRPVLVSAHYDTVEDAPGANDNGTGCVGVLEIARVLKNVSLSRDVVFAVFAFEEIGLIGSLQYEKSLSDAQLPAVIYNLETCGFTSPKQIPLPFLTMPATGDFAAVISAPFGKAEVFGFLAVNDALGLGLRLVGATADANVSSNPVTSNLMRSDHAPFWARGVPGIMITDTANFRDANHYHDPSDTKANVDFAFFEKVVKATLASVYISAKRVGP